MKGKFITIEGIDGSGKTTIAKILHEKIPNSVLTYEPTDGWIGKMIKGAISKDVDGITISLLFCADRNEHLKEIRKWLGEGKIVICDRYFDSTLAYQKEQLKFENAEKWLLNLQPFLIKPDLTILLKIEPKKAMERIKRKKVFFENEEFLEKVQKNYLEMAKEERFFLINAEKSIDEIVNECLEEIKRRKII
ncbi:MAG: dTMP kinase [Thermoplasmatales archaeon]|nr:dTMP kinase [Thermoplasmatales archaeon]